MQDTIRSKSINRAIPEIFSCHLNWIVFKPCWLSRDQNAILVQNIPFLWDAIPIICPCHLSATNIVVETQLTWLCFALRWKQEDSGWARCRQWGTERGVVHQVVHLGNLQLMNTENSTQKNTAHRARQDTAQLMSPLMDGIIPRLTAPVHWLFTPLPPQKLPLLPQRQLKSCQVFT